MSVPAPKTNQFWILTAVTSTCSAAFVWFLFSLHQTPAPEPTPVAQTPPPVVDLAPSHVPTEKWSYIDRLENHEITVDLPSPQTASKHYVLQCGSFRQHSQAQVLKEMIALQGGLISEIHPTREDPPRWYRVILGPYASLRLAEKDRNTLKQSEIFGCQISLWANN